MREAPAALGAGAVAAGILLGDRILAAGWTPPDAVLPVLVAPASAVVLLSLAFVARDGRLVRSSAWRALAGVSALVLCLLAGALGMLARCPAPCARGPGWLLVVPRAPNPLDDERFAWTFRVVARRAFTGGRGHWVPEDARLHAALEGTSGARAGVPMLVRGTVEPPTSPRNPGEADRRARDRHEGFAGWLRVDRDAQVESLPAFARPDLDRVLEPIRAAARSSIGREFRGASRSTLLAILFAEKDSRYADVVRIFRRVGVTHVLALSGMHLVFVGAVLLFPVRFASRGRRTRALTLLACFVFFTLLVHAPASLLRAAVGAALFLFAKCADRSPTALQTVWALLFLLFLFAPSILFDLSFQLSAGAVLGMLLFARATDPLLHRVDLPGPARWLLLSFLGTAGALLGTAPISIRVFGQNALLAPIANLFAVPVSGLIVMGGEIALLVSSIHAPSGHVVWASVGFLVEVFLRGIEWIGRWEPFRGPIPVPPPWAAIGAYGLFPGVHLLGKAIARWRSPGRGARIAAGPAVVILSATALALAGIGALGWMRLLHPSRRHPPGALVATVLDVGQGDAILLEFPGGETWLVDGGSARYGDPGDRVLVPVLRARGIRRLDAVVLSHAHEDHFGGLRTLLDRVPVRTFYESGISDAGEGIREIRSLATARGGVIRRLRKGDSIALREGAVVRVLWPAVPECARDPVPGSNLNNASIVFEVAWRDARWLFPGDLEAEGEASILDPCTPSRLDFLKVGHHGSATSSSPAFLSRAHPAIVAVSVGARNRFGHPSRVVLSRLACSGATVFRTDDAGAIRIVSDGAVTVASALLSRSKGICYIRARSRVPASRGEGRESK